MCSDVAREIKEWILIFEVNYIYFDKHFETNSHHYIYYTFIVPKILISDINTTDCIVQIDKLLISVTRLFEAMNWNCSTIYRAVKGA